MPKDTTTTSQDTLPRIDLRIPGPWMSPAALMDALKDDGEFQIVDGVLVHVAGERRFEINVSEPDDEIAGLFEHGGRMPKQQVKALAAHKVKVHVSGPGGSVEAATAIMEAGAAVVRAGGLGVMVDNSAACHPPQDWLDLTEHRDDGGVYWAFVVLTGGRKEVFSTGMHCLGYRDAELPDPPDVQTAAGFIHEFLGYCYQSGRTVIDGDCLNDLDGPLFRAIHHPCTRYRPGTPFHNPYGVWRLEAAREVPPELETE